VSAPVFQADRPRHQRPSQPTGLVPVRFLRIVLVPAAIGYAFASYTPGGDPSVDAWLRAAVLGTAVLLVLLRVALRPRHGAAWLATALGIAVFSIGDLARRLPELRLPSYPAPTDVAVLLLAPLLLYGTLLLLPTALPAKPGLSWLDGALAGLGAAALAAGIAMTGVLDAAHPDGLARLVDIGRPVADVIMIGVLAGALAMSWWRASAGWLVLAGGGLLLAATDLAQLAYVAVGRDGPGAGPLHPLAVAVIASAAWVPGLPRAIRRYSPAVLVAPLIAFAVALGLLLYGNWRPLHRPAVLLAGACLLLYGVRSALAYRETRALVASRREAATDYLTGVSNRRQFDLRLSELVKTLRPDDRVALVLLGLDRFKEINDTLGHDVGDALLRQVGPRLREVVGAGEVIARLAGDKFAVLALTGAGEVVELGRRLRGSLEEPFLVNDVALHLDASVGIAAIPQHAADGRGLVRGAEAALRHAKTAHTGVEIFDPAVNGQRGRANLALVEELRVAFELGQLTLYYQPIVELRAGAVVSVEALVRWRHPTRGLLPPDAFLRLAEQAGLMRRLTVTVLGQALGQSRAWRELGLGMRIAVNLHISTLLDARLPYDVARLLNQRGVHPSVLTFEITEDVLMADPDRARRAVDRLRTLGVGTAIDDYGRGSSSLALLRTLPMDELKLDRSLISEVTRSRRDAAIARSAIDLAHSLGLRVTAEGVQSAAAAELLYDAGCDLAQGNLVCPALPPRALTEWLIRQGVASAEVPPPQPGPELRPEIDPALHA
jgi:diguanylate cyclase (GGDEF)-like protein